MLYIIVIIALILIGIKVIPMIISGIGGFFSDHAEAFEFGGCMFFGVALSLLFYAGIAVIILFAITYLVGLFK